MLILKSKFVVIDNESYIPRYISGILLTHIRSNLNGYNCSFNLIYSKSQRENISFLRGK